MDAIATIVVGIDGSPASRDALVYALRDAGRRHARLRVVAAAPVPQLWGTAVGLGMYGRGLPPTTAEIVADVRAAAQRMIDEVSAAHPETAAVPIDLVTAAGSPAEVLLSAARDADLLVLGHRGRGGITSALLGSVGLQCVLHATCPVTVVRPQTASGTPAPAADGTAAPATV